MFANGDIGFVHKDYLIQEEGLVMQTEPFDSRQNDEGNLRRDLKRASQNFSNLGLEAPPGDGIGPNTPASPGQ